MSTEKQIVANRLNARKSTGPITPEGCAAVRLNSLKHGLSAKTLILPGETEAEFNSLLGSYEAEYCPSGPTEETLVRDMAMATWRRNRFLRVETAFLQNAAEQNETLLRINHPDADDTGKLAYALSFDSAARTLTALSTYEGRLERSFHKALRELQHLQAQRLQAERQPPARSAGKPAPAEIGSAFPISKSPAPSKQIINIDRAEKPATLPEPGSDVGQPPKSNIQDPTSM